MDADAPEPGPPGSRRTEGRHRRADERSEQEEADQEREHAGRDAAVPESFDVTEPTEDGGPVHHATGGDIGDGGD